jgi:uncharacterized protein YcbK (DUF882 family)
MKHFTIKELTKTNTGLDNTPSKEITDNLTYLVDNLLDKVREEYGNPITVNSGYRSPEVNKAVGGAKTSQHLTGCAADITTGSKSGNERLFNIIKQYEFDQLINEHNFS